MYSIEKIGDKYILKGHAYNGFNWMQDVDLENIMVLNLEGIQFEFEIEDYRPSIPASVERQGRRLLIDFR